MEEDEALPHINLHQLQHPLLIIDSPVWYNKINEYLSNLESLPSDQLPSNLEILYFFHVY